MKMLFLFAILTLSLFGHTSLKELKYESGISIYGQVGFVDLSLEENFDKHTYVMKAIASSTGIVKVLSKNRTDSFVSEGKIKNGVYLPMKFTKKVVKTDYEKVTTYLFDYKNKSVQKSKVVSKYVRESHFDMTKMNFVHTKKFVVEKSSKDITLYKNDFLSLYLNLQHGNLSKGEVTYVDKDEEDSLVIVDNNLFEVEKNNGDEKYKIALVDDKKSIFFKEALSIDVSFYGDAYIKKISEKTKIVDSEG